MRRALLLLTATLLASTSARAAPVLWSLASSTGRVVTLDVTRTPTGYSGVLHEPTDLWANYRRAVPCPGPAVLPAGSPFLTMTRRPDGTFDLTLNTREYPIGPAGLGSAPASDCPFQPVHHHGYFADRAAAVAADRAQVGLLPPEGDTFLILEPTREPCPVPEDATHTCAGVFPRVPLLFAPMVDTDDDGLFDEWELGGLRAGGQVLDLPAMGANPDHKDLFVQIDATAETAYTTEELSAFMVALADLPVSNPDGHPGIALHLDAGPNSKLDLRSGRTWGALARGDPAHASLPEHFSAYPGTAGCPPDTSDVDLEPAPFRELMARRLDPIRARVFRYVAVVKYLGASDDCFTGQNWGVYTSGFVVSDFVSGTASSSPHRLGTFLHELGHSLGLLHGGDVRDNYKPNYLSVMNYLYQLAGLRRAGDLQARYTYSATEPTPTNSVDEAHLDEAVGVRLVMPVEPLLKHYCSSDSTPWFRLNRPEDLDCSGLPVVPGVRAIDLTPDNHRGATVLRTFNDVAHLKLPVPPASGAGGGARGAATESLRWGDALHRLATDVNDRTPPTVRLAVRPGSGGRVATVTTHDDVGLGSLVVTSGGQEKVVRLSPPTGDARRDSTSTVDVPAAGPVSVVVSDLVGHTARASAP